MRCCIGFTITVLFVVGTANVAHAEPVKWDLQDVSFNDSGLASGSFIYDADMDHYLSWSIATSQGTDTNGTGGPFPGFTYTLSNSFALTDFGACTIDFIARSTSSQSFCLNLTSPLTDAGGAFPLLLTSGESYPSGYRLVTVGGIEDPPRCGGGCTIPEPSTLVLLAIGIATSFLFRHSRREWP